MSDSNHNLISGSEGDDSLRGTAGDDRIEGHGGNDRILDHEGNNILSGGAGDDFISGTGLLDGGTGNDRLTGTHGNEVYFFNLGDGNDIIEEYGGNQDVIGFGEGIDPASIVLVRDGQNMIIRISDTQQITVSGWFADTGYQIEAFLFADGTRWDTARIANQQVLTEGTRFDDGISGGNENNVIRGGAGNDSISDSGGTNSLHGGAGDDLIQGGSGDDTIHGDDGNDQITDYSGNNVISGGAGNDFIYATGTIAGGTGDDIIVGSSVRNDIYLFDRGDGRDTVSDRASAANVSNRDEIRFGEGIEFSQLWFSREGADLVVSVVGTTDRMTIRDWYGDVNSRIEIFRTHDGRTLSGANVEKLVNAMAPLTPPATGETALSPGQAAQLGHVLEENWTLPPGHAEGVQPGPTVNIGLRSSGQERAGHAMINPDAADVMVDAMAAFAPPPSAAPGMPAAVGLPFAPMLASS